MSRCLVLAALALALASPSIPAASFISLDLSGSQLTALSANGCVAAGGVLGSTAGFRWRATSGAEPLGDAIAVHGLSPSGVFAVGSTLDGMQREVAGYWDAGGKLHRIAPMADLETIGAISQAHAVSDEPRIVGSARRPGGARIAFEWSTATGMHELPLAAHAQDARAIAISPDGRRLAGWGRSRDRLRALYWQDGQLLPIGADAVAGEILGGSRDAQTLVGWTDGQDGGTAAIYRAQGIRRLATASTVIRLQASSDDGKLLVGDSGSGDERKAWIWFEHEGFIALSDFLARRQVPIPPDWKLLTLTAVSADGTRLGGWGKHKGDRLDSFIVDLSGSGDGCSKGKPHRSAAPAPAS